MNSEVTTCIDTTHLPYGFNPNAEVGSCVTDLSSQAAEALFKKVLDGKPEDAYLCAGEKLPGGGFINTGHSTLHKLTRQCLNISDAGHDAYFAIAFYGQEAYETNKWKIRIRRTAENALGASSFIADVDVGVDKTAEGKGYATLEEAEQALTNFCQATGIPLPNSIVISGYGLHLYWTTGVYIPREKWRKISKLLKKVFHKHGFRVDPTRTADIASVLRPPGTVNYKDGGCQPVYLVKCEDHIDLLDFVTKVVEADRHLVDNDRIELGIPPGHLTEAEVSDELKALMNPSGPISEGDQEQLRAALRSLDPDMERSLWLKVIFASKDAEAHDMSDAKELAREWSMSSKQGKYNEADFERSWESGQPDRADGVHYPTIFHMAREAGWEPATPVIQPPKGQSSHSQGVSAATGITVVKAATLQVEPIHWIWSGWLAAGKVHILAGVPGTGKTSVAMALGATITIGGRWPDGSLAQYGQILIWSAEDDPADTLIPRLIAAGADLERVHIIASALDENGRPRGFDPASDMDSLSDHIALMDPKPALLIIDPIVSAVAGDSHKNAEVRRSLQPLVDLAMTWKIAVLGITHFTKGTAGSDPIDRVTGSLAFAALARVVLVAAKLPDDHGGGRVLARGKSNIGRDDGGFRYDLQVLQVLPGIETTHVLWGARMTGSARDILAQAETIENLDDRSASSEASDWLRHQLAAGPQKANDLLQAAKRDGISIKSLRTARKKLGVQSTKGAFAGGWVWHLPGATPVATHSGPDGGTEEVDGTPVPDPSREDHEPDQVSTRLHELHNYLAAFEPEDAPSPLKVPEDAELP